MKNIQVIDGGGNTGYWIYPISNAGFKKIFPARGQNIEFIEDFVKRVGKVEAGKLLGPIWKNRLEKETVQGIHGILFYQLRWKRGYYPNKRESDLDDPLIQGAARVKYSDK